MKVLFHCFMLLPNDFKISIIVIINRMTLIFDMAHPWYVNLVWVYQDVCFAANCLYTLLCSITAADNAEHSWLSRLIAQVSNVSIK